jgi:transposase
MMALPSSVRIYVASAPVDLRKGFYKLASLARAVVKADPLNGHIFVFLNKRRNRVKCLWWDRSGWLVLYKKLDRGRRRGARVDARGHRPAGGKASPKVAPAAP